MSSSDSFLKVFLTATGAVAATTLAVVADPVVLPIAFGIIAGNKEDSDDGDDDKSGADSACGAVTVGNTLHDRSTIATGKTFTGVADYQTLNA